MFEEIAYEKANKKYPIPKVTGEIEISRNYRYGEGFKDGASFVYSKAKDIMESLIETLTAIDGEQIEELKIVKEAEKFLKEDLK